MVETCLRADSTGGEIERGDRESEKGKAESGMRRKKWEREGEEKGRQKEKKMERAN